MFYHIPGAYLAYTNQKESACNSAGSPEVRRHEFNQAASADRMKCAARRRL